MDKLTSNDPDKYGDHPSQAEGDVGDDELSGDAED